MNLLSRGPQSELNKHQTMTKTAFIKIYLCLWPIGLSFAPTAAHAAAPFLVENGEAGAEIIIAESPARTPRLASMVGQQEGR